MERVVRVFLLMVLLATCGAQMQMKTDKTGSTNVQVNIDEVLKKNGVAAMQIQPANSTIATPTILFGCDGNSVLLDVLKNLATPEFVQAELDFETNKALGSKAIYQRRMSVIKNLAGKK